MFGGFKASKCKILCQQCKHRIKLLRNKKQILLHKLCEEVAQLMRDGKDDMAWIRLEGVIREENMLQALEVLELYTEQVSQRGDLLQKEKEIPIDMRGSIASIVFAASRIQDLPELKDIRKMFQSKYGKGYIEEVSNENTVVDMHSANAVLVQNLIIYPPTPSTKLGRLQLICAEHDVAFDEEKIMRGHDLNHQVAPVAHIIPDMSEYVPKDGIKLPDSPAYVSDELPSIGGPTAESSHFRLPSPPSGRPQPHSMPLPPQSLASPSTGKPQPHASQLPAAPTPEQQAVSPPEIPQIFGAAHAQRMDTEAGNMEAAMRAGIEAGMQAAMPYFSQTGKNVGQVRHLEDQPPAGPEFYPGPGGFEALGQSVSAPMGMPTPPPGAFSAQSAISGSSSLHSPGLSELASSALTNEAALGLPDVSQLSLEEVQRAYDAAPGPPSKNDWVNTSILPATSNEPTAPPPAPGRDESFSNLSELPSPPLNLPSVPTDEALPSASTLEHSGMSFKRSELPAAVQDDLMARLNRLKSQRD